MKKFFICFSLLLCLPLLTLFEKPVSAEAAVPSEFETYGRLPVTDATLSKEVYITPVDFENIDIELDNLQLYFDAVEMDAYSNSYVQGQLEKAYGNVNNITYKYHTHTGDCVNGGGCYTIPYTITKEVVCGKFVKNGDEYTCSTCGKVGEKGTHYKIQEETRYELGCKMTTNTIVEAVIDYYDYIYP